MDYMKRQTWFRTAWRPAMAWQYLAVCLFDFIIAPTFSPFVMWSLGFPFHEWKPLTLQGGGTYHIAMGAVLGVAAYTRSQELQKDDVRSAIVRSPASTASDDHVAASSDARKPSRAD